MAERQAAVTHASPAPAVTLIDPVAEGLAGGGIKRLCDRQLDIARRQLAAITRLDPRRDTLGWHNTMEVFDDLVLSLDNAASFPHLMGVAHPDERVREAARRCEIATDTFASSIYLDVDLARVVAAYARSGASISGDQQRLLDQLLRDLRRGGASLAVTKRAKVLDIDDKLSELGQRFVAQINGSNGYVELPPEHLAGLSDNYRQNHPQNEYGLVRVTTSQPDYFPFIKHARERNAAKELYIKFVNRGGRANVERLQKILRLRHEKATLLGYASWADYALEARMMKTAQRANGFVGRLLQANAPAAEAELLQFAEQWRRLGQKHRPMTPPDRPYLQQQLARRLVQLNDHELAQYFEVEQVTQGLFEVARRMYGVSFQRLADDVWHPSVRVYRVIENGVPIGRVYLDLFAREGKYKSAAMFPLRTSKLLSDGTRQWPMAALLGNFAAPGQPMPHQQVVTYFHEFGHLLHYLFAIPKYASFAGIKTARDFDEAPAQLFEEWAFEPEVLNIIARHRRSGQPPPADMVAALNASRGVGIALHTERQLLLAMLDLRYHSVLAADVDTTRVLHDLYAQHASFPLLAGTHPQSSFSHLIGYDAGYYSYQWALTLVHEALARFRRHGLLDANTAAAWRRLVLAPGASRDEAEMISAFIGHPPSEKPYLTYLTGANR